MIGVFLCDDEREAREAMRLALDGEDDMEIVGEADNGAEALTRIRGSQPDVVVLDLNMPQMDGLEVLAGIRVAAPSARVVIFTGFPEDQARTIALRLGATHFLAKGASLRELVVAVREAAAGSARPAGRAS